MVDWIKNNRVLTVLMILMIAGWTITGLHIHHALSLNLSIEETQGYCLGGGYTAIIFSLPAIIYRGIKG